jgi:hypothetical protein
MWIFGNLDYYNIDYFFRHVIKSFGWMWEAQWYLWLNSCKKIRVVGLLSEIS